MRNCALLTKWEIGLLVLSKSHLLQMLISTLSAQIVLQFDSKQHENNGFKSKLCGVISVIISLSSVLFHTTCEIWLRAVWRANPNRLFTCVDKNPQSWLFYAVSKEGTDNTSEDRQNNHLISSDLTTRMNMQIIKQCLKEWICLQASHREQNSRFSYFFYTPCENMYCAIFSTRWRPILNPAVGSGASSHPQQNLLGDISPRGKEEEERSRVKVRKETRKFIFKIKTLIEENESMAELLSS